MKTKIIIVSSFCLLVFGIACSRQETEKTLANCPVETSPFPSYASKYPPTKTWCQNNKPFELSQSYPTVAPSPENLPWTAIVTKKEDFKNNDNWKKYLYAILNYAYQGNLENDWIVKNNNNRNWYHAPYMHADGIGANDSPLNMGREFIHGLTMEKSNCRKILLTGAKDCGSDSSSYQNWAVSFYNAPGGFYIGEVWREMYNPTLDPTKPNPNPNPKNIQQGFPEGTVVIKLLFTEADDSLLAGSVKWEANISDGSNSRKTKEMRLLQIDVAVREREAVAPTGWIYGSFVYKAGNTTTISYPTPVNEGWLKFVPIGLMYGNNDGESINEQNNNLPFPQHQGCNQYVNAAGNLTSGGARTNGPIDNPASSCIACHASAETFDKFDFTYLPTTENKKYKLKCDDQISNKFWFRNINPRSSVPTEKTLSPNAFSLDFSLQLRNGIDRCCRDGRIGVLPGCKCDNTLEKMKRDFDQEMFR